MSRKTEHRCLICRRRLAPLFPDAGWRSTFGNRRYCDSPACERVRKERARTKAAAVPRQAAGSACAPWRRIRRTLHGDAGTAGRAETQPLGAGRRSLPSPAIFFERASPQNSKRARPGGSVLGPP